MNINTKDYIISGGQDGKSRLNVLAGVMHGYTQSLLQDQGLRQGMSMLDLGCGGGHVSMMASGIVGEQGRVTAVDFDAGMIALVREDLAAQGFRNISLQVANVYDISFEGEFDIAYSRFLLSHLERPLEVLMKMKDSVKPGGKIIVEDVCFDGHFCDPACSAFDKYVRYYIAAAKSRGADANIGAVLAPLFQQAGIGDIGFDIVRPEFSSGPGKWMAYLTLEKIKETLVSLGLASAESVVRLLQELEQFTLDDKTTISLPLIFRIWGVKK